jgi:hypothetical protein
MITNTNNDSNYGCNKNVSISLPSSRMEKRLAIQTGSVSIPLCGSNSDDNGMNNNNNNMVTCIVK